MATPAATENPAGEPGEVTRAWLLALMAVAVAARFLALGRQSFWYDEAVSVELARTPLMDLLSGRVKDLGNPPLYPALLRLWMAVFGQRERPPSRWSTPSAGASGTRASAWWRR
jgi:uncharacterized membrane protein